MAKDSRDGLQPGRDPDEIDAAQAALNRMREAASARGEVRQRAPRPGSAQNGRACAIRGVLLSSTVAVVIP
jgi:hypothetical protein